jgi:hypothetical protein
VETRHRRYVAELVEDGATLQMGIGAIPNAVLAALRNHRDLGIHTEMFSDGAIDLIEKRRRQQREEAYSPGQGGQLPLRWARGACTTISTTTRRSFSLMWPTSTTPP